MTLAELFRRTAGPLEAGVNGALPPRPMSVGSTAACGVSVPPSCGQSDPLTGWVCTMAAHRTPIHRDQSDEAFECTWSDQ